MKLFRTRLLEKVYQGGDSITGSWDEVHPLDLAEGRSFKYTPWY